MPQEVYSSIASETRILSAPRPYPSRLQEGLACETNQETCKSNTVSAENPSTNGATRGVDVGTLSDSFSKKPTHHSSSDISSDLSNTHTPNRLPADAEQMVKETPKHADNPSTNGATRGVDVGTLSDSFSEKPTHHSSSDISSDLSNTHTPNRLSADAPQSLAEECMATQEKTTLVQRKNSCCSLQLNEDSIQKSAHKKVRGQGILFQVTKHFAFPHYAFPHYALLTCHHIIPTKKDAVGWKVHFGKGPYLYFKIDKKMISRFISCCGSPDGIMGCRKHDKSNCPFHLDFSLIILEVKSSGLHYLLDGHELPDLKPHGLNILLQLMTSRSTSNSFTIYQRHSKQLDKVDNELFEWSKLKWDNEKIMEFTVPYVKKIGQDGSSGSPGYAFNEHFGHVLYGMRTQLHEDYLQVPQSLQSVPVLWILQLISAVKNYLEDRQDLLQVYCIIYILYYEETEHYDERSLIEKAAEKILQHPRFRHCTKEQLHKLSRKYRKQSTLID